MTGRPMLAVLITCHNRRETTLRALHQIAAQAPVFDVRVFVHDDASTDGTVAAIEASFPDTVIVHGKGDAFWNGGLYHAWLAARQHGADFYLWLNDDVSLDEDAFARLSNTVIALRQTRPRDDFILVGATRDAQDRVSYGGMRRASTPLRFYLAPVLPSDHLQAIDAFNGNIVLVPGAVVDKIGLNDPAYFHNWGDLDYGLRARKAGIQPMLMPGTLGICADNDAKRQLGYGSPHLSLAQQWKKVNTHHGLPYASWWRLTRRHSGIWWPFHFLLPYRWLVIPRRPKPLATKE